MSAIFIIGPPRSGTTLLRDLLAAHPDLAVHGEDFHPLHHDLTLFRHRTEREDHFRFTCAEATPEIAARYREAIEQARAKRRHFVLKISTLSIQVDYVRALVPEARFIQLVRDPRDVACSAEDLRRELEKAGQPRLLGPAPDPLGLWVAAHSPSGHLRALASWSYHATRSLLDLRFCGEFHRWRYEDLLQRPRDILRDLQRFIGVEPSERVDALASQITDRPGRPSGLGFSTTQAPGARRVGRWRDELSPHVRTAASPLTFLPMQLLGYEPEPWPEVEPFFAACRELGIDPELWRDRAKSEAAWFERQWAAFAPERQLRGGAAGRLLLIDGAQVGTQRSYADAASTNGTSWVQKQERRHTFADPQGVWPTLAAALDGTATAAELQARYALDPRLLPRLVELGFIGLD